MAAPQNFRTALSGFNRDDVVRYIEYMNSKHESELSQLRESEATLREQLRAAELNTPNAVDLSALEDDLADARRENAEKDQRICALNEQIAAKDARIAELSAVAERKQEDQPEPRRNLAVEELEAYRRAERAEARAKERVNQLYDSAAGILSDSALKLDGAVSHINTLLEQVMTDLEALQAAMSQEQEVLRDTSSVMYGLKIGE